MKRLGRKGDEVFTSAVKAPYFIMVIFLFVVLVIGVRVGLAKNTGNYIEVNPESEYQIYRARVLGCLMAAPPGGITPSLGIVDLDRFTQEALEACLQQPTKTFRIQLTNIQSGDQNTINIHPDSDVGVPKIQRSALIMIKDGEDYSPGELVVGLS